MLCDICEYQSSLHRYRIFRSEKELLETPDDSKYVFKYDDSVEYLWSLIFYYCIYINDWLKYLGLLQIFHF